MSLDEQIRDLRLRLRAAMNGPVSQAQRREGLTYRVNFGVDLPRLETIAAEVRPSVSDPAALAAALWKTDTRELRLLAPMFMPAEAMPLDLALLWVEQLHFAEEAQVLVFHLFVQLPFASDLAFRLVAADVPLHRLTAWLIFGRLFMAGHRPGQRDADEILDHLDTDLTDQEVDLELRRTALNTLYKFMDLGAAEEARGQRILDRI